MSKLQRRLFISSVLTLATSVIVAMPAPALAQASNYPNKTITLVTPFGAGSPFDLLGRVFADRLDAY
jgi:tripartite-type tricarboxylate transporter receptor subunit TctC